MRYRLPLIYQKLLILCVVFGPILWLMFTEDGQRRTDTMVLWLFGEEEIGMDFKTLSPQYTEQEMAQVYANLLWRCRDRTQTYGDRHCVARIGIFNGIPARYLTAYYRNGRLNALKLHYRAPSHGQLESLLNDQLGKPIEPAPDAGEAAAEVLQWRTPRGLVLMKRELVGDEEPALFWLSSSLLAEDTQTQRRIEVK